MRKLSPLDMMKILLNILMLLGFILIVAGLLSPSRKDSFIVAGLAVFMDFAGVCIIQSIQHFSRESNGFLNMLGLVVGSSLGFLSWFPFLFGWFAYTFLITWDVAWFLGFMIILLPIGYILERSQKPESWIKEKKEP